MVNACNCYMPRPGGCPACNPIQPVARPDPFAPVVRPSPWVIGCICPPTSEATCQRPDCGRKPPRVTSVR